MNWLINNTLAQAMWSIKPAGRLIDVNNALERVYPSFLNELHGFTKQPVYRDRRVDTDTW